MSQTAKVKSTSVKEGNNSRGPWINTLITTIDGAKIGTFEHSAAGLKEGDEFEYEPEVKGNKLNIKDGTFKILKSSQSTATPGSTDTGHQAAREPFKKDTEGMKLEYEYKGILQAIERASIEAQTAYNGVIALITSERITNLDEKTRNQFNSLIAKGIKWGESRLELKDKPAPVATPTAKDAKASPDAAVKTGAGKAVDASHPFPHIGALLQWWSTQGGTRETFMEVLHVTESEMPRVNLSDAYASLLDYLKAHPKASK